MTVFIIVIYKAPQRTFKPKLEKNKKILPEKYVIFHEKNIKRNIRNFKLGARKFLYPKY